MDKTLLVDGHAAITLNENNGFCFEFLPDDMLRQLTEGRHLSGKAQLMGSGSFSFTPAKPRVRNNALLITKLAHGRLSGTRDKAVQLTLKCFASEALDWQRAFVEETVTSLAHLMGTQRMTEVLNKLIIHLQTT